MTYKYSSHEAFTTGGSTIGSYDGSTRISGTAKTSYTNTGLSNKTAYGYSFQIKDNAGNISTRAYKYFELGDSVNPDTPTGFTATAE